MFVVVVAADCRLQVQFFRFAFTLCKSVHKSKTVLFLTQRIIGFSASLYILLVLLLFWCHSLSSSTSLCVSHCMYGFFFCIHSSKLRTLAFSLYVIHSNCFEVKRTFRVLCSKCWFWYLEVLRHTHWYCYCRTHSVSCWCLLVCFFCCCCCCCRHTDIIIIVLLVRHLLFPIIWWRWKVTGKKMHKQSILSHSIRSFFSLVCFLYFTSFLCVVPVQFCESTATAGACCYSWMFVYVMCYGLLYKCAMFDIERDRQPIRNIDDEVQSEFLPSMECVWI